MKRLAVFLLLAGVLQGCMPSLPYRIGQGIVSERFTPTEIQTHLMEGTYKTRGPVETNVWSCLNYSESLANRHLVEQPLKEEMQISGGNAVYQVKAAQNLWTEFFMRLMILPGFLGCRSFEVSGMMVKIQGSGLPDSDDQGAPGSPPEPTVGASGLMHVPREKVL